jgi:poly [ADP-ribose] polymerase
MFGHGIYFANTSTKSANYCSVRSRAAPRFLFLADVAIGRVFVAPAARNDLRAPPDGYDSVLGKAGHTAAWLGTLQHDEHIVYSSAQQTLRYLVTFDR